MLNWFRWKKSASEEEILNVGLRLAIRNYARPIHTQLQEQFSSLTKEELDKYSDLCEKVAKFGTNEVHKLARTEGTSLKIRDLKPKLMPEYSWVNDDNILSLISWGTYVSER